MRLVDEYGLTHKQQLALLDQMGPFKEALTSVATGAGEQATKQNLLKIALGETKTSTADNTQALKSLSGQAVDTRGDVSDLADTIRGFGSATLSTRDAQRQFEQSFDDLSDSIKENGTSLDVSTQKGRDNQSALDDLAKSTLDYAAATYEQTGNQDLANQTIAAGRKRLIDMLAQFGITGDAAGRYADQLGLVPSSLNTALTLTGAAQVISRIQAIFDKYNGHVITIKTAIATAQYDTSNDSIRLKRASGGILPGMPSRTDNMLIHAASGEFIVNAQQTSRNRAALEYVNSGGVIHGYANGGFVRPQPTYERSTSFSGAPVVVHEKVPTQLTVTDANGALMGAMQVVASQTVAAADEAGYRSVLAGRSSR